MSAVFWDPPAPSWTMLTLLHGHSVTDPEPLPDGHALFSLPNVVLTPHCSWTSKKNFVRACDLLEENVSASCLAFFLGKDIVSAELTSVRNLQARRIDAGQGALNALRGKGEGNQ